MSQGSPRRVLFVAGCWYPDAENPASGIFIRRHAEAVAPLWPVAVLHPRVRPDGPGRPRASWQRTGRVDELVVDLGGRPTAPDSTRASRCQLWRAGRLGAAAYGARFGTPELVHFHVIPDAALSWAVCRAFPTTPVLVTEHWSGYMPHSGVRLGLARRLYTRLLLRRAAAVTTVSAHLGDAMRQHGFRARYEVVPNVVDTELFRPATSPGPKVFRLVHVACLRAEKRVDRIVEAVVTLRRQGLELELVIVGEGPERRRAEAVARDAGELDRSVFFRGQRPEEEVAAELRHSDALVLFSRFENSPCVIAEALACGVPVIAPRVGGVPELVDPHSGVLIDEGDEQQLRDAVSAMARGELRFDATLLRRRACDRHSMTAVGRRFVALYEELLAPSSHRN